MFYHYCHYFHYCNFDHNVVLYIFAIMQGLDWIIAFLYYWVWASSYVFVSRWHTYLLFWTNSGDLVMPDPFWWLFSQNLDNFRPYKTQVIRAIILNVWSICFRPFRTILEYWRPRGFMNYFVPRGWMIFFGPERLYWYDAGIFVLRQLYWQFLKTLY